MACSILQYDDVFLKQKCKQNLGSAAFFRGQICDWFRINMDVKSIWTQLTSPRFFFLQGKKEVINQVVERAVFQLSSWLIEADEPQGMPMSPRCNLFIRYRLWALQTPSSCRSSWRFCLEKMWPLIGIMTLSQAKNSPRVPPIQVTMGQNSDERSNNPTLEIPSGND